MSNRITGEDLLGIAYSLDTIQKMNQRNTTFKQSQEDRKEKKTLLGNARKNFDAIKNNPDAELVGTPEARLLGRKMLAEEGQTNQLLRDQANTGEYEKSLGGLITWKQSNPESSWDDAPLDLYRGANGQKAYAEAIRLGAETVEGKQRTQAAITKIGQQAYPTFAAQKELAQKSLQSGDLDLTVTTLQNMSKTLPMPYKLGEFDKETQSFDVQYLDSNTGEFQSTRKMPLKQVMGMVNAMGEEKFNQQIALHALSVDAGNREKRQNPLFGKNANGDRFLVIPQKQWANPNSVEIEVRNEKTNEKTIFPSWKALQDFGINIENLGREDKLKGMEVKDQQIETSKAAMESHNRANQGKKGKLTTTDLKYMEQQAEQELTSKLKGMGLPYDSEERTVMVPVGEGGEPDEQILRMLGQSGFSFTGGKEVKTDDKVWIKNLFGVKDGYAIPVHIGAFNPKRQSDTSNIANEDPEAPQAKGERPPLASFESGGSGNDDGKETQPDIRPELPQDMNKWDVQTISQNGQPITVLMTENGPVPLTEEEIAAYKEFSKNQEKPAVSWFKKNMTGTQKIPDGFLNRKSSVASRGL